MAPFAGAWVTDTVLRIITKGTHEKEPFLELTSMANGKIARCAMCSIESTNDGDFLIKNHRCNHVFHRHCFNRYILHEWKMQESETQDCPTCGVVWYDLMFTELRAQLFGFGLLLMRTKDFGKGTSELPVPIDSGFLRLGIEIAAYSAFMTGKISASRADDGRIMVEAMLEAVRRMDWRPRRLSVLREALPHRASAIIHEWYPGRYMHWKTSELAVAVAADAVDWYGTTCVPLDSCEDWTMEDAEQIDYLMVRERSKAGSEKPFAYQDTV